MEAKYEHFIGKTVFKKNLGPSGNFIICNKCQGTGTEKDNGGCRVCLRKGKLPDGVYLFYVTEHVVSHATILIGKDGQKVVYSIDDEDNRHLEHNLYSSRQEVEKICEKDNKLGGLRI